MFIFLHFCRNHLDLQYMRLYIRKLQPICHLLDFLCGLLKGSTSFYATLRHYLFNYNFVRWTRVCLAPIRSLAPQGRQTLPLREETHPPSALFVCVCLHAHFGFNFFLFLSRLRKRKRQYGKGQIIKNFPGTWDEFFLKSSLYFHSTGQKKIKNLKRVPLIKQKIKNDF